MDIFETDFSLLRICINCLCMVEKLISEQSSSQALPRRKCLYML